MNKIEMVACNKDDLPTIQRISRQTFYDTFSEQNTAENMDSFLDTAYSTPQLEKELDDINSKFYFVKVDGDIAGYSKENAFVDYFELERIYIDKEYQKIGLGKMILDHAISSAKLMKLPEIRLGVWEHNDNAIAFYKKMGFYHTGQHVFKLGDDPQTDLLMTKKIRTK